MNYIMTTKKGFTIIEVALVLAIAGIIFIMVFIALPALQAAERDTERRDDVMTIVQQLKNFSANNNRGALPSFSKSNFVEDSKNGIPVEITRDEAALAVENTTTKNVTWEHFYMDYFDKEFADPDGGYYTFSIVDCSAGRDDVGVDTPCPATEQLIEEVFPNGNKMYIVISGTCDGEYAKLSANSRKVAVLYKLEAGGAYCQNT